jgi:TIR domain-containing protein
MGEQAQEVSDLALTEPVSVAVQQAWRPDTSDGAKLRVFISYSRNDIAFAEQLTSALKLYGFECLIDHHSIAGGEEWKRRLGDLISEADTIIFVLSPKSARSKICTWEVEEAVRLNKRILPIHCQTLEGTTPPPRLRDLNYIPFHSDPNTPGSGFGNGLARLVAALNTDYDWVRKHSRYFQRATEWNTGDRPANRLLSGDDIAEAKAWAARRPKSAPEPMDLHLDFIRASEQEAEARSSEQRKHLEMMAAAQAEREKALHQAEEAQKQAADVQRKRARIITALVVVSFLAVVAGCGWATEVATVATEQKRRIADQYHKQIETAEQYRKNAEQQKEQKDAALVRATQIVTQGDKDKDPAKVREFLEWAAENGSVEARTALRLVDEAQEHPKVDPPEDVDKLDPAYGKGNPEDLFKPREPSEKPTAKANKNARFKPLSTASRATFWRWWGSHLAIQVSPAAHRATASVHW